MYCFPLLKDLEAFGLKQIMSAVADKITKPTDDSHRTNKAQRRTTMLGM